MGRSPSALGTRYSALLAPLRLTWLFVRLNVLNETQYRGDFFVQLFQTLVGIGTSVLGIGIVFGQTDELRGWRRDESIALVGVYFLVNGLTRVVIVPSMERLMEGVRQGTLDFTLTKPADAQLLVSIQQVQVWRLVDVGLGLAVLVVALVRLGADLGFGRALGFAATLVAGTAIVYSFLLMLATCAFWFVRLENILVIFGSLYEAGRWPIGIYPPWLRVGLTFVVPVAFAITIPAEALVGRLAWPSLLGAVALAAAFLFVSRRFWRFGLRHYTGASA